MDVIFNRTTVAVMVMIAIVFFFIGLTTGFFLWHKNAKKYGKKEANEQLSQLQKTGIGLFIGYQLTPIVGLPPTENVVTVAIIALIAGEKVGVVVANAINGVSKGKK